MVVVFLLEKTGQSTIPNVFVSKYRLPKHRYSSLRLLTDKQHIGGRKANIVNAHTLIILEFQVTISQSCSNQAGSPSLLPSE